MTAMVRRNDGALDEAAVRDAFAREGLSPHAWSNGPGDTYARHTHAYDKVLYCTRGSITFQFDNGEAIELFPGDRLDIERGTPHAAVVGPLGVTCLEASR